MTDRELHDLLHERVADLSTADLSGAAWDRATRIRRRRAAGVVAGAVASVAVVAVALAGLPGVDRSGAPPPATTRPSPSGSSEPSAQPSPGAEETKPDARYRGRPVYYGPLVPQEETLPVFASPFPRVVDLSVAAPDLADQPITSALAAYALVDDTEHARLLLLAPDGSLRSVDTSRVAPYDDGAGQDISVANEFALSPTGQYVVFAQPDHVLVLTLATGQWRTVHTGGPTTTVQWLGDTDLWLPPTTQGGQGPLYSALDGTRVGSAGEGPPAAPFETGASYGRWRMGPAGIAQSWTRVAGLPVPRDEITPSQVLLVQGDPPADDALLVLSASSMSGDHPRPDLCCGVKFWLDDDTVVYESDARPRRLVAWKVGTHSLGWVTQIEGYDPGREDLVSSYARIWR